jgi:2,4-dienoyl-CoA reductase-like NADH-dependent reductase (Old Yellow Enzyme family)
MISSPIQAERIPVIGKADAVLIAREFLRDPGGTDHCSEIAGQRVEGRLVREIR